MKGQGYALSKTKFVALFVLASVAYSLAPFLQPLVKNVSAEETTAEKV